MKIVSDYIRAILMAVILCVATALGADTQWPVKGNIDLSSGFCEFRPAHFHGGIDIRTGGKEGREIFAPADGYVWRIRYSYTGYGKGLYLKDGGGRIYVFGHLSRLSDRLEKIVRAEQYGRKRYSFDITLEPDSLPVKAGELIAYSGQSGNGAPHIHFEVRNRDNQPLNPLRQGFGVVDNTAPEISQVAFIQTDESSLFDTGERRRFYETRYKRSENLYYLDSVPLIQGPLALAVRAYDRIRENGPRLSIYGIKLYIDDYLYYEAVFDSYDYGQTGMVDLVFDYASQMQDQSHWHRLYNPPGMVYPGSRSVYENGGIFSGKTNYSYGLHSGRVEAYDAAGNKSEFQFKFVLAPPGRFFEVGWRGDSLLHVQASSDVRYIDLEQLSVYGIGNSGEWHIIDNSGIQKVGELGCRIPLPHVRQNIHMLKITAIGSSGWSKDDVYLTLTEDSRPEFNIGYRLDGEGVVIEVSSRRRICPIPEITAVYGDGYKKSLPVIVLSPRKFAAFIRPGNINADPVRIEVFSGGSAIAVAGRDVSIKAVGHYPGKTLSSSDGVARVEIENGDLYFPVYLELYQDPKWYEHRKKMATAAYSVGPTTVPLAAEVKVSFAGDFDPTDRQLVICRLNSREKWKPLETKREAGRLVSSSGFLGIFAVLKDDEAPVIKKIYPSNQAIIRNNYPEIQCTVSDDISGIESDEQVLMELDGEWLIPEYDPETEILKTTPRRKLNDGRHELKITVADKVGNIRTIVSEFTVKTEEGN
jgi:hypothetical protein